MHLHVAKICRFISDVLELDKLEISSSRRTGHDFSDRDGETRRDHKTVAYDRAKECLEPPTSIVVETRGNGRKLKM